MEDFKHFIDGLSVITVLGSLIGALPAIAAGLSIVWTLIRIFESDTVQGWFGAQMILELIRDRSTSKATTGRLLIDGAYQCCTLEDVVRPAKIAHETAIPAGTYKVVITESPRFKRRLPLLVDVPGFDGIRIHPGNSADDTDGCILVGTSKTVDWISGSRVAFDALFAILDKAGPVTITIKDAP